MADTVRYAFVMSAAETAAVSPLPNSAQDPEISFAYAATYAEDGYDTATPLDKTETTDANGNLAYILSVPGPGIVYYRASFDFIQNGDNNAVSNATRAVNVGGQFPVTADGQRVNLVTWIFTHHLPMNRA